MLIHPKFCLDRIYYFLLDSNFQNGILGYDMFNNPQFLGCAPICVLYVVMTDKMY
jgi:hypothetical protein